MIYVASSWRNPYYPRVLEALKLIGIDCYDWRDEEGFHWSDVFGGARVEHWTDPISSKMFKEGMQTVAAYTGFLRDMRHLNQAEALILLLPCGKSAHLEAGWAVGAGIPAVVFAPTDLQPELMYGMFGEILTDLVSVGAWACAITRQRKVPS